MLLRGRVDQDPEAAPYNRRIKSQAQPYTLRAAPCLPPKAAPGRIEPAAIAGVRAADLDAVFRRVSLREGRPQGAERHCTCTTALPQGAGPRGGRRLVFRFPGRTSAGAPAWARSRCFCTIMRLRLALSSLKLKPWPFPGRIALRERAARSGEFPGAEARPSCPRSLDLSGHRPVRRGTGRAAREARVRRVRSPICTRFWCVTSRTTQSSIGSICARDPPAP